ncbi:hypothetical protein HA402_009875 [Bradysia odoriphaga]|nr:hypothetical protein HA402_009875 [Bradysia odoriphaga]
MSSSNLKELENKIGYFFKNRSILKEATTHSSLRTTNPTIKYFERLEFLGDTVVQMAITEYLFKSMDGANEGTLSIKRAKLVGRSKQTEIANQLQLSRYINKSPGVQENFKRYDQFLEAIIGSVYADTGFGGEGLDAAKLFVYKLWKLQPTNTNVETNCIVM